MEAFNAFQAFADYQSIVGAPDNEVSRLLQEQCGELTTGNWEDQMLTNLTRVFRFATGVPWVRGWENAARPDETLTGVPDGQYGTIYLLEATPKGTPCRVQENVVNAEAPDGFSKDFCERWSQQWCFTFQLDVYRDAGVANRSQENTDIQGPIGSAFDVLSRLQMRLHHTPFRDALKEKGIQYQSRMLSMLRSMPREVQGTWETRANTELTVFAQVTDTMRIPGIPPNTEVDVGLDECDPVEPQISYYDECA